MSSVNQARQKYNQALSRLANVVGARKKREEQMYQDYLAKIRAEEAEFQEEEARKAKDWFSTAAKGAEMGFGAGGWIGAIVGAVAGAVVGQVRAVGYRMKEEGKSGGKAFLETHFDFPGYNLGAKMAGASDKEAIGESGFPTDPAGALGIVAPGMSALGQAGVFGDKGKKSTALYAGGTNFWGQTTGQAPGPESQLEFQARQAGAAPIQMTGPRMDMGPYGYSGVASPAMPSPQMGTGSLSSGLSWGQSPQAAASGLAPFTREPPPYYDPENPYGLY